MKRLAALAAAAGMVLAGLAGVPAAEGVVAHKAPSTHRHHGYMPPPIKWRRCDSKTLRKYGARCGTLIVPLDYGKPHGKKISLAVSRVRHTVKKSKYQGIMITNPGGPGGSGLIMSVYGMFVPRHVGSSYDWIGFDPRGVGDSKPSLSCDSGYFKYDRPSYTPRKGSESAWLKRSKHYAHACKTSSAHRLLGHIKTTTTVKDMESMRKALHRKKINYYGFSYGTYLGQVYATQHPDRVRRMVLDSNVDPRGIWYQDNLGQDFAFDRNIKIYFTWLAKYDSVYHLGSDPAAIEKGYYDELARLDANPTDGVIGPDELTDVMQSAGYYVFGWEDIAKAYSSLLHSGDSSGVKKLYDSANSTAPGGDNGFAMYLGTECSDAAWPHSWKKWDRDSRRVNAKAPFLTWANAWFNAPCAFWPARAGHPVRINGHHVKSPVLLIDETNDAATPFSGSLAVRNRFPSSALVEGVGGTTHAGSLSGDACVDNSVARYLANGKLAARKGGRRSDKRCAPLPEPVPTVPSSPPPSSRTAAPPGTSTPNEVRAMIMNAQLVR